MYETLSEALAGEQERCEHHACQTTEDLLTCDECKRRFCWLHGEDYSTRLDDQFLCFECDARLSIEAADAAENEAA